MRQHPSFAPSLAPARRQRRRASTAFALVTAVLACQLTAAGAPAWTQVVVSALAEGFQPLEETTGVRCTRFASLADDPALKVGAELLPGDFLASVTGEVDVELRCPRGTLLRFSGGFRVVINAPDAADCAVDLLSGTLDVLTDGATEVDAGGVVLGTEGTQYSVDLIPGTASTERKMTVYDGRVSWRAPAGVAGAGDEPSVGWVEPGRSLDLRNCEAPPTAVSSAELRQTAVRYARFDVAQAQATGGEVGEPEIALRRLTVLHLDVLRQPAAAEPRVDLARAQLHYQVAGQARYNLDRAGVRSDRELERHRIDPQKLKASTATIRRNDGGG